MIAYRPRRVFLALLLSVSLILPVGAATADPARSPGEDPEPESLVRLVISGTELLDAISDDFDLAGNFARVPHGFEVDALVTAEEAEALVAMGVEIIDPDDAWQWGMADTTEVAAFGTADFELADNHTDTVHVGRVDYFTTRGQGFLSVEAKTSEGTTSSVVLDVLFDDGPGTEPGDGGTRRLSRFIDSGVYMFHRLLFPVDGPRPNQVQVISSRGGSDTGFVSDWLGEVEPLTARPGYQWSFVDGYKDPTQLFNRLDELAAQYPDIAEVVYLPNETNGYQRKAQALFGTANANRVVVTSNAWGHEGGNDLFVQFLNPGAASQPLSVEINGNLIVVSLATSGTGALSSTAAQVAAALNANAGNLVSSHTYRGNAGNSVVAAAGPIALTDFLTAPDYVERGPFPLRAIRIGRVRDGSKPGVLIVAQDHAREWVTPMIAIESIERLLANYATDVETRKIVNNVDIFIVPSNNPDGSHYSHHDFASQRRNMTNHCGLSDSDPGRRNAWGVDLNRNFRVGSGFDGYTGSSTSCTSDTYRGPAKLSEPEAKNVIELVEANRNIKFFMTIHSNGGQLFWQPGAYIAQGRITTPRPEMRDEAYYWQMAGRILSHVKAYQDTVVRPDNVGGSSDVLYSSAGNVREDLYNNYGIYAFGWEVGGSVWNPVSRSWQGGSFQPNWAARGYGETMEYTNGIIEMFRIAADYGKDFQWPKSSLVVTGMAADGSVAVQFETTEPATVYYTTDGSRPTLESSRYQARALREGGQTLYVSETTTFNYFSVDPAGNIEQNYNPQGGASNYRKTTVTAGN